MTGLSPRRALAAVGTCALLMFWVSMATADSVRPVQILVKELPSGHYDVKWSVPKVIPPRAMPSPRMPDGSTPVGARTFTDRPAAWITQQVYQCPGGLAGQLVGVDFPLYNIGLSTLIRVELLSGYRYAHLLSPGEDAWRVPEAGASGFAKSLVEARQAVIDGGWHFVRGWVHLAFLLAICLVGSLRVRARLATAFLLAQLGAVALFWVSGLTLDAPLAEIGVAIATLLLAREALRPPNERSQLTRLAVCAGVVHGLGLHNLFSPPGDEAFKISYFLFVVLGMDAALLISATVVTGIGHLFPRSLLRSRIATSGVVYGIAGVSVALAIGALVNGPASATNDSEPKLRLPSVPGRSGVVATARSRRIAATTPDAAIQSFVAIERFEVRHEVLVRLKDIAEFVGVGPGAELAVEDQRDVMERIGEFVLAHVSLEIDGKIGESVSRRVDVVTLGDKGVLVRSAPQAEPIETAWVGVTDVYLTTTMARDVAVTWEFTEVTAEIPATVIDPESSVSASLTKRENTIRWQNKLAEDTLPAVSAIAVEPARLILPLGSLLPLVAALLFAAAAVRRRKPLAMGLGRVMLALAVFLGPIGNVAIAVPWATTAAPNDSDAKRILAGLLPNVYRALEFREETTVFDRLALSVTGETLTEVYLDQRRVLETEQRGGARVRVEAVEVVEVDSVERESSGGFSAEAVWTVGGTVTHFGHRHFRQNSYDALITVVPDQGTWKLQSIELLHEERLQ